MNLLTGKGVDEIEALWALIVRVLGVILGMLIVIWQLTIERQEDPLILAAWLAFAAGCMGPFIATGVAQVASAFRGGPEQP